jgi:hypothetical protein
MGSKTNHDMRVQWGYQKVCPTLGFGLKILYLHILNIVVTNVIITTTIIILNIKFGSRPSGQVLQVGALRDFSKSWVAGRFKRLILLRCASQFVNG